ncbi:uncharacterized protein PV06_11850 [Exophiala oligosperma]|uniref:Uncharacterized protein n=1 Tax=Exophiala oligosperma TaxID=215243 RepID=A0A0D2BE83_9EURO|nr:uncharacterized protein PV06_11850 [Exophiala oligosperma]KIW35812.1 hypothetical protein PV06_11850 [Exophiala oligosperma]
MHTFRAPQEVRNIVKCVILHIKDLVQIRDRKGWWKHQWELPLSPTWEQDHPQFHEFYKVYLKCCHPTVCSLYEDQGFRLEITSDPKFLVTTAGLKATGNQVLVIMNVQLCQCCREHASREKSAPTLPQNAVAPAGSHSLHSAPANVEEPTTRDGGVSVDSNQNDPGLPSTALQQSPAPFPIEKLIEPRVAAIYQPYDLQDGDVLTVHGSEGVTLQSGSFGSMILECKLVKIAENQGDENDPALRA